LKSNPVTTNPSLTELTDQDASSSRGRLLHKGQQTKSAIVDAALGLAHITVNKNSIPNDPESPFVTSGIRIGSPAITTRGFKEEEARQVANLIAGAGKRSQVAKVCNRG
jgi:glycine/serine hydroxymethyltransferase